MTPSFNLIFGIISLLPSSRTLCILATIVCTIISCWFLSRRWRRRRLQWQGRSVLVTGAASGIGRELARELARRGARLVLWDLDAAGLAAVADELRDDADDAKVGEGEGEDGDGDGDGDGGGGDRAASVVVTCTVDLSDKVQIRERARETQQSLEQQGLPPVSVVVNNAGVVSGRSFLDLTEDEAERTVRVNTLSHFWILRQFLPDMVRLDDGLVITMASLMGLLGGARLADYCARYGVRGYGGTGYGVRSTEYGGRIRGKRCQRA